MGNSAILCELAKKGVKERDEEGMESMNIALETVVGMKEEKKAANVVPDKVVEKKEIVKDGRVRVSDLMGWESVDYSVTELVENEL